jgi:F-type H+-transporting ATPase subunit gamma
MPDLEGARKRYETAGDLLSVVKMMKALAAANIREYEQAGDSLEGYLSGIMLAFRGLLRDYPLGRAGNAEHRGEQTGVIVFGSDQGMCGQFNDRIAAHALTTMDGLGLSPENRHILSVGQRAFDRLAGLGLQVEESLQVPGSPAGMTPAVQNLIGIIDRWSTGLKVTRVLLEYNHHLSGALYEPVTQRLLPLDREWLAGIKAQPWPTHVLPVFHMDADRLFSVIVKHYLIASLYRAFAESLASENASRLAAMQGAEKNIRDRIVSLRSEYHQARQVAITEELLDIISGFTTLEAGR